MTHGAGVGGLESGTAEPGRATGPCGRGIAHVEEKTCGRRKGLSSAELGTWGQDAVLAS